MELNVAISDKPRDTVRVQFLWGFVSVVLSSCLNVVIHVSKFRAHTSSGICALSAAVVVRRFWSFGSIYWKSFKNRFLTRAMFCCLVKRYYRCGRVRFEFSILTGIRSVLTLPICCSTIRYVCLFEQFCIELVLRML